MEIINKEIADEEDLPHFGGSNKKDLNNHQNNIIKNEDVYMNNQSIDDIITENSNIDQQEKGNLNTLQSKSAKKK